MPYINLIEEQRLAIRANERSARTFFVVFVSVLVASAGAYGFFTFQAESLAGQAAEVEAQNQKNAPLVKEIEANQKLIAELTPRLSTLTDAQLMTDRWNRLLKHLTMQTPNSAWLTGMRCTFSDPLKPIEISFNGAAEAQAPIGEFMLRLQNLPDLENVNLKYTNEKLIATQTATEFEIGADIVDTAEKKVKEEAN
jgi:Tfp pilus assembly protein PilN